MIFEEDKAFARAMLGDDVVDEAEQNAVLVHEGVKGMKWGIWNAETRARRLRERADRIEGKAKSKEEKLKIKNEEAAAKLEKKLQGMSNKEVLAYAQKEFKKKAYNELRNVKSMSLKQLAELQGNIEKGEKLLGVSFKDPKKKTLWEKIKGGTSKAADLAGDLGKLGENIPKIQKGYNALFGNSESEEKSSSSGTPKKPKTKKPKSEAGRAADAANKFAKDFADNVARAATASGQDFKEYYSKSTDPLRILTETLTASTGQKLLK